MSGYTLDREIGLGLVILGGGFLTICLLLAALDGVRLLARARRVGRYTP